MQIPSQMRWLHLHRREEQELQSDHQNNTKKIEEGKAVIALTEDNDGLAFVILKPGDMKNLLPTAALLLRRHSGKSGIAKSIKRKIFDLSREKYPDAKIFGLTTGLAVMKINSDLGYEPVTYSELTDDENFWAGCKSCVNYDILMSKERKNCMCTAMLYDPADHYEPEETAADFKKHSKQYERFMRLKQSKLLKFLMGKKRG